MASDTNAAPSVDITATQQVAANLNALIETLQNQLNGHVEATTLILKTASDAGIELNTKGLLVTTKGKKGGGKRKPKSASSASPDGKQPAAGRKSKYDMTASAFIMHLIEGHPDWTIKELNEAWQAADRPGNASTTISQMVGKGLIKRITPTEEGGKKTFEVVKETEAAVAEEVHSK